jgi:hypothetical protein
MKRLITEKDLNIILNLSDVQRKRIEEIYKTTHSNIEEIVIKSGRSAGSMSTIKEIITITEKMIIRVLDDQQRNKFLKILEEQEKVLEIK